MQHASTTLTRHPFVVAGWRHGTARGGLRGACRRGGGAVEGGLQHRHSSEGIVPNHTLTLGRRIGYMLIAAYLGLVCLQSCMRVYMLMRRERERERERAGQFAAEKGHLGVSEALLSC